MQAVCDGAIETGEVRSRFGTASQDRTGVLWRAWCSTHNAVSASSTDLMTIGPSCDCLGHHAPRAKANLATAYYSCEYQRERRNSRHSLGCFGLAALTRWGRPYTKHYLSCLRIVHSHSLLFYVITGLIRLCSGNRHPHGCSPDLTPFRRGRKTLTGTAANVCPKEAGFLPSSSSTPPPIQYNQACGRAVSNRLDGL